MYCEFVSDILSFVKMQLQDVDFWTRRELYYPDYLLQAL